MPSLRTLRSVITCWLSSLLDSLSLQAAPAQHPDVSTSIRQTPLTLQSHRQRRATPETLQDNVSQQLARLFHLTVDTA